MFEIAFDLKQDQEKRETAMNNLLVLSKENAGSEIMFKAKIVSKIQQHLKFEKNEGINIAAIRILSEMVKNNAERTEQVVNELGIPWLVDIINSANSERVNSVQYLIQVTFEQNFKEYNNKTV